MKKTATLGLLLVTTNVLAAQNTSTSKAITPITKKWGIALGSTTLQVPNSTKGTEKLYGLQLEGSREFNLNFSGLTTTTRLGFNRYTEDDKETRHNSSYAYSFNGNLRTLTFSVIQTLNKKIEVKNGILNASIGAGISRLSMEYNYQTDYTYNEDPNQAWNKGGFTAEAFGKTLLLRTSFELKSGLTPYMAYQTTDYNSAREKDWYKDSDGTNEKDTQNPGALSAQTITLGAEYKF